MAHAYTTKRGKNKKAKLNMRKDHQQNMEKSLKSDPLANMMYDGPKESVLSIGHLGYSSNSRLENVVSRLQKSLLDKCSNPVCKNSSSDGTLSECSSCHQARYCSRDCQLAHWTDHKEKCKEIKKERLAREKEKAEAITAALQEMNLLAKPVVTAASTPVDTTSIESDGAEKGADDAAGEEESEEEEDDNLD